MTSTTVMPFFDNKVLIRYDVICLKYNAGQRKIPINNSLSLCHMFHIQYRKTSFIEKKKKTLIGVGNFELNF